MKGKIAFVLGAAVGYVLGTRAGRERYEQIARGAETIWHTAPVQRGVEWSREFIDQRVSEMKTAGAEAGSQLLNKLTQRANTRDAAAAAPAPAPAAEPAPAAPGSGTGTGTGDGSDTPTTATTPTENS